MSAKASILGRPWALNRSGGTLSLLTAWGAVHERRASRITTSTAPLGTLAPCRVDQGTAHIQVSLAEQEDVQAQMRDALAFLERHQSALRHALAQPQAEGVLDFAVAWRDAAVQVDVFPADWGRLTGQLGMAWMFSHDPSAEFRPED